MYKFVSGKHGYQCLDKECEGFIEEHNHELISELKSKNKLIGETCPICKVEKTQLSYVVETEKV